MLTIQVCCHELLQLERPPFHHVRLTSTCCGRIQVLETLLRQAPCVDVTPKSFKTNCTISLDRFRAHHGAMIAEHSYAFTRHSLGRDCWVYTSVTIASLHTLDAANYIANRLFRDGFRSSPISVLLIDVWVPPLDFNGDEFFYEILVQTTTPT